LEKNEALLVSLDEVIQKFAKAGTTPRKRVKYEVEKQRVFFVQRRAVLTSWKREYSKLSLTVRRGNDVG
jgi:hypothetical protein